MDYGDDVLAESSSQPDQYARENQLSVDSRVDPFSLAIQLNSYLPQLTSDSGPSGLTSDSSLSQLQLPTFHFREHLDVPKESIDLLAAAFLNEEISEEIGVYLQDKSPLAQYETRKRLANLKIEPPALFSDPDYDCRELARTIREQQQPHASPATFPPERLNIANDEGLEFPDSTYHFAQKLNHSIRSEKIDAPKETIYHLSRALHNDWTSNEQQRMLEEAMLRRIFPRELGVTPPLSPFAQDGEYFIPDAEVCEIPVASDPSSMLSDDIKAAELAIVRELKNDVSPVSDIETPQLSPVTNVLALSAELPKVGSIKIETPLLPFTSPLLSKDRDPNIPALLRSMDIDHTFHQPESLETDALQTENADSSLDHDLQDEMVECAASLMKNIEQERVSAANAIARVEVPIMDFSIERPEWQNLPSNTSIHIQWIHGLFNVDIPCWPKNSQADSELRWVPFLHKNDLKALTNEQIDDDRDLLQLLDFPDAKEVQTSADYVWKQPGLAILREPDDEEDLPEPASPPGNMRDLVSLVRKRRYEDNLAEIETGGSSSSTSAVELVRSSRNKTLKPQEWPKAWLAPTNLLVGTESSSAVSTLLSNYIEIRTAKRQKQERSSFFPISSKFELEPQVALASKPVQSKEVLPSRQGTLKRPEKDIAQPAPCPTLDIPDTPTRLIKGLTLSRGLFTRIEQLYPSAEIIERDFDRWNTIAWDKNSVSRSPVVSSLAAEADIIVSPITGIIVTTLLKIIQKPLPGHRGQSAIRERVSRVALLYERLLVLVSEGNIVDETVRDLTPSEITAYADFVGFVSSLDIEGQVFYVGGGEDTLAKWLVSFATRHAPEAAEVQEHLVQDETQWELFLRRAGCNAYAAQAILARLKAPDDIVEEEGRHLQYGLAAFVMMTSGERVQNFQDLMGGERVLNRVSSLLDTSWS
ncbi:hypothetical protein F5Y19DRAFT_481228 [Xylariaceae sp. FL1651]|nr:hypothetical protein F5Y19DRAFT_481228 [Xylariaceae sp. FL1651]